jgi:hypothetical protein
MILAFSISCCINLPFRSSIKAWRSFNLSFIDAIFSFYSLTSLMICWLFSPKKSDSLYASNVYCWNLLISLLSWSNYLSFYSICKINSLISFSELESPLNRWSAIFISLKSFLILSKRS